MASALDFLTALMDGEHPHSLCAAGDGELAWCGAVGFYSDPQELLDAADRQTRLKRGVWFGVYTLQEVPAGGRGWRR